MLKSETLIVLASRICLLCGRYESTVDDKIIYWLPDRLPHHTNCPICGGYGLVPEIKSFRVQPIEPSVDWAKPVMGRPSKRMLEERRKIREYGVRPKR